MGKRSDHFNRVQYQNEPLEPQKMKADPAEEFAIWYQLAIAGNEVEPNAMCLATVDEDQQPHARMVLMKSLPAEGLTFFTNYRSQKALDLEYNAKIAVTFWWSKLYRQVRITGTATKLSTTESAKYFATRSDSSQINAIASPQTQQIVSREWLLQQTVKATAAYKNKAIACPVYWGGYRIAIKTYEFWQGLEHRLHDRIYYYQKDESWRKIRLAP